MESRNDENAETEAALPVAVIRLSIGSNIGGSFPGEPPANQFQGSRYLVDFQSYLVSLLGLAHMIDAGSGGIATAYRPGDAMALGCKQSPAVWTYWPFETARILAHNATPNSLILQRTYHDKPPSSEIINLGSLSDLLNNYGSAMINSYYEANAPLIKTIYSTDPLSWPSVWNFGRVVRNAMSHGGTVTIINANSASVSWKGLSYGPSDNGRSVLHTDLWPGDLFDLIQEMDAALP